MFYVCPFIFVFSGQLGSKTEKSEENTREQEVESCYKHEPGELFLAPSPLYCYVANSKCGGVHLLHNSYVFFISVQHCDN